MIGPGDVPGDDQVAESERLRLRPMAERDLPALQRWLGDPEVTRYWIRQAQPSMDELRAWLDANRRAGSRTLAIETKGGGGVAIGYTDVFGIDREHRKCEIALMIGERSEWRKGYAREALTMLLGYLFGSLGMHKVTLSVFAENEAARRAYRACGFREDGVLRDDMYRDGRWHDQILMSIVHSEFEAGRVRAREEPLFPD